MHAQNGFGYIQRPTTVDDDGRSHALVFLRKLQACPSSQRMSERPHMAEIKTPLEWTADVCVHLFQMIQGEGEIIDQTILSANRRAAAVLTYSPIGKHSNSGIAGNDTSTTYPWLTTS